MPLNPQYPPEIRETIIRLYSSADATKILLSDCGVEEYNFSLNKPPKDFWHEILVYLFQHGIFDKIADYIIKDFPERKDLAEVLTTGVVDMAKKEIVNGLFGSIIKDIDSAKFGEISRVNCNRSEAYNNYYALLEDQPLKFFYLLGNINDNADSFAERMILEDYAILPPKSSKDNMFWFYRRSDGDNRVDEIPFEIHPVLDRAKKYFCRSFESIFADESFETILEKHISTYKKISILVKYNFNVGKKILQDFSQWLVDTLGQNAENDITLYFAFYGLGSGQKLTANKKTIVKCAKSISDCKVQVVECFDKARKADISSWVTEIGVNPTYVDAEFISDIKLCLKNDKLVDAYIKNGEFSMSEIEYYQDKLYQEYLKNNR